MTVAYSAANTLPDPGPCTPKAHCFARRRAICECGGATRQGSLAGWKVASRLTSDEIMAALGVTRGIR